jgi:putative transcriptional regulator
LGGKFLVATEQLRDPRFARSVVYMVRHDRSGAMGLIVNRVLGVAPWAELLRRLELDATGVAGEVRMHYGGPVESGRGFVLHTGEYAGDGTMAVNERIALTINPDILRAIGLGKGPRLYLLAFGYAGWAPGQLEGEIARGDWISVPADEDVIFDTADETKWERAMARRVYQL